MAPVVNRLPAKATAGVLVYGDVVLDAGVRVRSAGLLQALHARSAGA
jgi:hypothetical protein